jgi:hypothetical protein
MTTEFRVHSTHEAKRIHPRLAEVLAPFEQTHSSVRRGRSQPDPFALVGRSGIGRGTRYRLIGTYRHLSTAAARSAALASDTWIVLAPGFTLAPRRLDPIARA